MERGKFIAIEGTDGSGKTVQSEMVRDELERRGHEVFLVEFPRYEEDSGFLAKQYLNGELGSIEENGAELASLYFAIDRAIASKEIRQHLDRGAVVIANRFIGSNMAHQGQKIENQDQRLSYYQWILDLEHNKLNVETPDMSIVLVVDPALAQKRVDEKDARGYTDLQRDLHESDINHLTRAGATYLELTRTYPEHFDLIDCMEDQRQLSIDDVFSKLISKVLEIVEE